MGGVKKIEKLEEINQSIPLKSRTSYYLSKYLFDTEYTYSVPN
jgi:hypothetical protein